MNRFIENWCAGSGAIGTTLASINLAAVKDVLAISFLVIQIFILLLGLTIKFFKFIDDGKIDEEEEKELLKDLDKITDLIDKEKDNDKN